MIALIVMTAHIKQLSESLQYYRVPRREKTEASWCDSGPSPDECSTVFYDEYRVDRIAIDGRACFVTADNKEAETFLNAMRDSLRIAECNKNMERIDGLKREAKNHWLLRSLLKHYTDGYEKFVHANFWRRLVYLFTRRVP